LWQELVPTSQTIKHIAHHRRVQVVADNLKSIFVASDLHGFGFHDPAGIQLEQTIDELTGRKI
jgi:hypothetical protein